MILLADIGGTNTRVALGDRAGKLHNIRAMKNADIADLCEPLAEVVGSAPVTDAVLAIAGPVDGDVVSLTNHTWKISRSALAASLGLRQVALINDFLAAAFAIPAIDEGQLLHVRAGNRRLGNILVCGPGTGFGTAALIETDRGPVGVASEAGHAVLGAADETEAKMFDRLRDGNARLSVESVLSGAGLSRLFCAVTGTVRRSEEVIALAEAGDAAANDAIALFLRVFGRVAGDLALAYDATAGVYIAGGVGRALARRYEKSSFLAAFDDHPPYSERLSRIPVAVLLLEQPGLLGALQYGLARIDRTR